MAEKFVQIAMDSTSSDIVALDEAGGVWRLSHGARAWKRVLADREGSIASPLSEEEQRRRRR
jgi:hypothetical protein